MSILHIITEVQDEVRSQETKWGHTTDDTLNTPWMWAAYIGAYATKWMKGTFLPLNSDVVNSFRTCMVKVAALAISAVDSLDRQRDTNGTTFYEGSK